MSSFELPADLRALMVDQRVEDLDVLAVLVYHADRWWDAEMIHRELGIGVEQARSALLRLARRNLLDIRVTHTVRYQFRPATASLEAAVLAFVDAYRRSRVAVMDALADEERESDRG